jgi:rhodanese-related sulfurtransferase
MNPLAPSPDVVCPRLAPAVLKAMLGDGGELAILDVREEGVFAKGHLLFACPLPLSRLELAIDALVPRRATRVVLCDGGEGLAERAAARLARFGYSDLALLDGGVQGWASAGYELFSGVHVPSKAFGEFVEHLAGTPHVTAAELQAQRGPGADLVILDSRPLDEYRVMSIPGAIDCPGAELVHRIHDIARSPETLVVVNCAGRTRSIIGAQSLIDAGIPNRVVALQNGTMGWHLAGLALEHGQERRAPEPSATGLAKARAAADRVARRWGVPVIGMADLTRFRAEAKDRTLYVFDVRSPEEYEAGHLPGARSAPGGQLVQATDRYVGTLNARLVLVDSDGVRARMTASWLLRMGWSHVHVMDEMTSTALEQGAEPRRMLGWEGAAAAARQIDAPALAALLAQDAATVVDLDTSLVYRDHHIPGAWFAIRSRLAQSVSTLPAAGPIVLASRDGVLATFAAPELAALTDRPVLTLAGGTEAWCAAELPLEAGGERLADSPEDVWYRPYDRTRGIEAAMGDYLRWELDLVEQVRRDGDARFRVVPEG